MSRPDAGPLKAGDEVFVIRRGHGRFADKTPVPCRIAKAARVWLDIETIETRAVRFGSADTHDGERPVQTWRMRRDSQNEGTGYSYTARFVTAEQLAHEQREAEARSFLNDQGVRVGNLDSGGPWYGREVELADLIRNHLAEHPHP